MVMDHVGAGFRALQCASVSSGRRLTHLATGRLPSALLGLFERGDQRAKSRMAIVSSATNEERRGAVDTASDTAHDVFCNSTRMAAPSQPLLKPPHVWIRRPPGRALVSPLPRQARSSNGRAFPVVPFPDGASPARRPVILLRHDHSRQPGGLSFSSAERIPSAPGLTPSG